MLIIKVLVQKIAYQLFPGLIDIILNIRGKWANVILKDAKVLIFVKLFQRSIIVPF